MFVDRTVDLDNQRRGVAIEVRDESVDDLLSAKVEPTELIAPQASPENSLRRGHPTAKLLREFDFNLIDVLADDDISWSHWLSQSGTRCEEPLPQPLPEAGRGVWLGQLIRSAL